MVTTKEYARLCSVVYRDGDSPPDGWERLKGRLGYREEQKSGFYAEAWKNEAGDIVLAVRGTANKAGVYNDLQLGVGIVPSQYKQLVEYHNKLAQRYPAANLSITGHSLGGGLAQLLAADLKHENQKQIHGETFEAPGMMHVAVIKWGPQHIPDYMACDVKNHMRVTDIVPWIGFQIGSNKYYGPEFNIEGSCNPVEQVKNIVFAQHNMKKLADQIWDEDAKSYGRTQERLKEIEQAPGVRDLPRNPHSKDLYNAYAKEVLSKNKEWMPQKSDREIATAMTQNGVSRECARAALSHSPDAINISSSEKTLIINGIMKELTNSPEINNLVKIRSMSR